MQYPLTPQEKENLIVSQNRKCVICGIDETSIDLDFRSLSVDHDHKTGEVRGALCHHCSLGLGCFKDKVSSLRKAITYLSSNPLIDTSVIDSMVLQGSAKDLEAIS